MSGFTAAIAAQEASGDNSASARWGAVYALALCSFVLVAAEFMPISLLSPIAATLDRSPGQVGQAIAASGIFALGTSLFVSNIFGALDRRMVLLDLTLLLMVSSAIVATAPSFPILMAGRALLGVAIGGFWSMSAAVAMRLVPEALVPKALAIVNGGNALASTVAAPLGSLLGGLIGWRGTFLCIVPIGAVALVWQLASLPSLPTARTGGTAKVLTLLRRPPLARGLLGVSLFFGGQFALFTYLRPFLERVTRLDVGLVSIMLLIVGVSGLIGTVVIGRALDGRRLNILLGIFPTVMAAVAVALTLLGASTAATALLLAVWGFAGTAAPVAWWTWLSRTAPDDAEAGGGLMVAVIQLAITIGSALGGVVFDGWGAKPEFLGSAAILASAALVAFVLMGRPGKKGGEAAMSDRNETTARDAGRAEADVSASWAAVWGLMLCAFAVNTSEFMPVGLISPIASTLDLSEGQMGQANAVSGVFAVAASLFLGRVAGKADRRFVLLGLMGVLLAADLVVGLAANPAMLMVGRAMLGTVVGGFWSMSASIAIRLVDEKAVPSAMAIVNGGSALGAALTGPVGSYVGHMLGWRGAFFGVAPFVAVAILWQLKALPTLPIDRKPGTRILVDLIRRRPIWLGLTGVGLYYAGQYSLFTYLRPFLEQVTGVRGTGLSAMLLVVGVAGLVGAAIVGKLLSDRTLYVILGVLPATMAATAIALTLVGDSKWATAVLLAVWGFTGTATPAGWWTWLARSAPDDAEAGGGLLVAVMQAAIALGAAGGGIVYDRLGARPEFLVSAGLLIATTVTVVLMARLRSSEERVRQG